jgi:hypothetical protein
VAWSVMAMVLDGRRALTRGLMDASTASARTTTVLGFIVRLPRRGSHALREPRDKQDFTNGGRAEQHVHVLELSRDRKEDEETAAATTLTWERRQSLCRGIWWGQ